MCALINISFGKSSYLKNIFLVAFEDELENLQFPDNIDEVTKKLVHKKIKSSDFKGKNCSAINVMSCNDALENVFLVGGGKRSDLKESVLTRIGASICKAANGANIKEAAVFTANLKPEEIANLALGLQLRNYSFNQYKTVEDKISNKISLEKTVFFGAGAENFSNHYQANKALAESVHFARDLVSEPANILYPDSYAQRCLELKKHGVEVEIFDEKWLKEKGFNALLGVAQGSSKPARLVVMQYHGASKQDDYVAFVGKGVTFDTGGISIKPSGGMEDMKYDMAGSAAVVGAMMALAGRKAKVNAVGVIGLVENMPDGNAQRPSDVVKSLSGQTIEILNTDAEGRLVLADALWYTKERFKPKFMVDLATLTGAIVISLGSTYAGLFSNDDKLADDLFKAGMDSDEKLWRLPLHKDYDKDVDSDIADVRNTQRTSRSAGSITAAEFLKRFVGDTPWAHLDIAGTAWDDKGCGYQPKGATGFGVRLLDRLVKNIENL
jgi:leucyl aminopeptidase